MAISFEQNGGFILKSEDETDRKDKDKKKTKTKRKRIILTLQYKEHLFWWQNINLYDDGPLMT